jgi:tartronate-semialdehyde synthase
MARMRTVDAVVAILEKEGATEAFGLPGAAINPFYSAMRAHGGIRHTLARHVEGASHMADGYTRAAPGNIGICVGTSGPAGTDMITGLYAAWADSVPILCITGQAPVAKLHKEDFQAVDISSIAAPVTKMAMTVLEPGQVPGAFQKAFYLMRSGRPGPVLLTSRSTSPWPSTAPRRPARRPRRSWTCSPPRSVRSSWPAAASSTPMPRRSWSSSPSCWTSP